MRGIMPAIIDQAGRQFNVDEADGVLARTDDALDQGRRRVATPDDRSLRVAVLTAPNIRLERAADAAAQPGRWAAPSRVKEGRPVKS